jgi:hypothetical protein
MIYHTEDYSRTKLVCRSLLGGEPNLLTGKSFALQLEPRHESHDGVSSDIILAPSLKARDDES